MQYNRANTSILWNTSSNGNGVAHDVNHSFINEAAQSQTLNLYQQWDRTSIVLPNAQREGYSGGARCKTCNKVYTGSVLPINSNNHIHTVYHPEEIVEQHDAANICNICGQVIGATDDPYLPSLEDTLAHVNTHGYDFDYRTISNIAHRDDWNLLWNTLVEQRSPYIVTSPAHTHCNDCGKDF